MTGLPDLPSGVYRHYKGPLYFVFGYGHDANAEDLAPAEHMVNTGVALGERTVVVYIGLELTEAHTGPRLAVRTADDFHAWVHETDGSVCPHPEFVQSRIEHPVCGCNGHWYDEGASHRSIEKRFTYAGPTWEGQR